MSISGASLRGLCALAIGSLLLAGSAGAQTVTATVALPAATSPTNVAVNPVTNTIYVSDSSNVAVINGATNAVTTIAVPNAWALAINVVTNKIYVVSGSSSLMVIDGSTNATSTVPLPAGTQNSDSTPLVVNAVTNKIYLGNEATAGGVVVVDGATNNTTTIPLAGPIYTLAVNPVTNMIYATNYTSAVTAINGATNGTASISVPFAALLAVNPVTNTIYASGSAGVTVINGATNGVTATITAPNTGVSLTVNPVTNQIYLASSGGVTAINGATNIATSIGGRLEAGMLGVDTARNKIYVVDENLTNGVLAVDGVTLATTTLTVGTGPEAIAVNPVTGKIHVSNSGSANVSVIDGNANATSTLASLTGPAAVGVNPATNTIYLANNADSLTVVNGTTLATTTISTGSNGSDVAKGVVVNPITNTTYMLSAGASPSYTGTVAAVNGMNNSVTSVSAGANSVAIALNPVTNIVYVLNEGIPSQSYAGSLTVINGATNAASNIGISAQQPVAIAVNPVTDMIYVASVGSNPANPGTLTVINGATGSASTVTVGADPIAIAVDSVTNTIYVANNNNGTGTGSVSVVSGATNAVTATISVSASPTGVVLNPLTDTVYVEMSPITVINGATNGTSTITAVTPAYLAVDTARNRIYSIGANNSITVIDGATNTTESAAAAQNARGIAVNPISGQVYIPNGSDNTLTILNAAQSTTVPLTASITPLAGNATSNPNPTFTFNASSSTVTVPDGVYFQLDSLESGWNVTTGSNPYQGTTPTLLPGLHILYAYAVDGQESALENTGVLEEGTITTGSIQAYEFLVTPGTSGQPSATTTTVTAAPGETPFGGTATISATVTSPGGVPTGTVNFTFTFASGSVLFGSEPLNGNGEASVQVSNLPEGYDSITASYSGSTLFLASSGSVTETVNAEPPVISGLTPSSGSGLTQTFSAVYTDTQGETDLNVASMMISATVSEANSCYVYYSPVSNQAFLTNDAGTDVLAAVTPGSSTSVSNSQCTLSGTGTSVSISGNSLTVHFAIKFASTYTGTKNTYVLAGGKDGTITSWIREGTWTPAGTATAVSGPPIIQSLTPTTGTGLTPNFTAVVSDPAGLSDLNTVSIAISPLVSPLSNVAHACYVFYSIPYNTLLLENDQATGVSLPVTPGSSTTVSNSQCTLSGAATTVTTSGNTLTIKFGLTFASTFTGAENVYLLAAGGSGGGVPTSWIQEGTWVP